MFKLNLKIALRNLWRNKASSLINVIGLAVGLASCLMLLLYVSYEWNFDKHAKNHTQVYEVMTNIKDETGKISMTFDGTTTALGPLIEQQLPEVSAVGRMNYGKVSLIAVGENAFKKNARFAEPSILTIYDYSFLAGDRKTALKSPNSVILTESLAKTLFGTSDALHREVRYQDQQNLLVTGIIKDLPDNSSNKFDFLMPWSLYEQFDPSLKRLNWESYSFITLIQLKRGTDPALVNTKLAKLVRQNSGHDDQPHFIYPLSKLHLYGKFENGKPAGGRIEQVWLFMGLAIGTLLIACINFMNMATAKSERRAKEVGIKKTIGANRGGLIIQFLTESMVLAFVAVILAIAIIEITLPAFNSLLDIKLSVNYFRLGNWLAVLGIALVTGLLAGSYPAFYLSSFDPLQTLRKRLKQGFFTFSLRQVLVVSQFVFTIALVIGTLVIYKQIQFIKNRPMGVEINALVELPQDGKLKTQFELLKSRLIASGAVTNMCQTSINLSHHGHNFMDIKWSGMKNSENRVMFNRVSTTYDFIQTNGIRLVAGRDFSPNFGSDSSSVLISASAARTMNLQDPLGKTVHIFGDPFTVVGVFDDYVWDTPYSANNPMVVFFDKKQTGTITMKLSSNQSLSNSLKSIEEIVKSVNPAYPVELNFIKDVYADKFKNEKLLGILANLFGGIAIFISCLGLYGLVAFSAAQRTKEFGVRKVLGASAVNLIGLLSQSFIKMILIAMLIAGPAAYYIMQKWLQKFDFHTSISWWILIAAGLGTLAIACITISVQAYKSAVANPVNALKYE